MNTNNILKNSKTFIFSILFVLISTATMAGNKVVKIKTSAICDMCKDRIELVVNNLDGIKKSMLNVDSKMLTVKFNTEKITAEEIRKAVSDAGYDADNIVANEKAYSVLPGCCKKGSTCAH